MKKILLIVISLTVLLTSLFFVYVSDYYHADPSALEVLQQATTIVNDQYTILLPDTPSSSALLFYPGGKVEHTAYLPLLQRLRQEGIICLLVKMPFRLAALDSNAADDAFALFPEVENWYIAGHSLGGAFASEYASLHPDRMEGLFLLGAYNYGEFSSEKTLLLYGSNDRVLNREKIKTEDKVFIIEGGNHAFFGNYGEQKGDGTATITPENQQEATAEQITQWINALG